MASLDDILKDTMLFTAQHGHGDHEHLKIDSTGFKPGRQINTDRKRRIINAKDVDPNTPIWDWKLGQTPSEIADIDCLIKHTLKPDQKPSEVCRPRIENTPMRVCDKINFGDVRLETQTGKEICLELTSDFLARCYYQDSGVILEGHSQLYPLEAITDLSMAHVFVYEFPIGEDKARKPDESVLKRKNFMPAQKTYGPHKQGVSINKVGSDEFNLLVVSPLRIVVIVSLVCGKARADFEPGEVLVAGRLNPHLMIMANKPMHKVGGSITVARPATSSMEMSGMNAEIEAGLYRDNNDPTGESIGIPVPTWGNLFDDFVVGWAKGNYCMVKPEAAAKTIKDAVIETGVSIKFPLGMPVGRKQFESKLRDVTCVARQGAFDNIHQAPTHTNRTGVLPFKGLDKIYMAPFCEHDCLHTHWRWGDYNSKAHQHGWAATPAGWMPTDTDRIPGKPNALAGAPMVPDNQTIKVTSLNTHTFRYEATAVGHSAAAPNEPIPAGSWTMIFHHGSGYSIRMADVLTAPTYTKFKFLLFNPDFPEGKLSDSGKLYWCLRYTGFTRIFSEDHHVQERLQPIKTRKMRNP